MIKKIKKFIAFVYRIVVSFIFIWVWYKTYEKYR